VFSGLPERAAVSIDHGGQQIGGGGDPETPAPTPTR